MGAIRGRFGVIIAATLWSTGGVAIKLTDLDAASITGGRAFFAFTVLLLAFPKARIKPSADIIKAACAYACTSGLFVWANTLTTAGNAIFIQNIAPVWVLLVGPFLLKEKATVSQFISVPISLLGCALFFADDLAPGRTNGNLLAFAASFSYAGLILYLRKLETHEGIAATLYGNLLIIMVCFPIVKNPMEIGLQDWSVLAYLGVIQQALAVVIFITAVKHISALEAALLLLLEPLFSPLWAFLLVGEQLGSLAIVGAVIVLLAAIGRNVAENWSSTGSQAQNGR